ncbi:hypothetical protein [Nonomuraea dietziae]
MDDRENLSILKNGYRPSAHPFSTLSAIPPRAGVQRRGGGTLLGYDG